MACLSADAYIYLEYGVARAARSAISSADTREAACEAPPPHQTPQSRFPLLDSLAVHVTNPTEVQLKGAYSPNAALTIPLFQLRSA